MEGGEDLRAETSSEEEEDVKRFVTEDLGARSSVFNRRKPRRTCDISAARARYSARVHHALLP